MSGTPQGTILVESVVLWADERARHFPESHEPDLYGAHRVSLVQGGRVVIQTAYTSSKFTQAEVNYATTEQELLALVRALQAWRCYLEMCTETELLTDRSSVQCFY